MDKILEIKSKVTLKDQEKSHNQTLELIKMTKFQSNEKEENERIQNVISSIFNEGKKNMENLVQQSEERLEILKRIEDLEKSGVFDLDVENDPEGRTLNPGEVDYLQKKFSTK